MSKSQAKRKTGLMYSGNFADYIAGNGYLCMSAGYNPWMSTTDYYDTPERVTEAYDLLRKTGVLDKLTLVPSRKEDKDALVGFHSQDYIDKLDSLSRAGGGEVGELCQIGHNGLDIIREAVGGDKNALDMIMAGKIDNAFCLQRPPSAHAERDQGFGFCVVNDFNILIDYARKRYALKKIMIIDFDNHYKKGIEDAWYTTDEVLYAEVHQTGALPENSAADRNADRVGEGKGKGYNVVIPMPSGAGDEAYLKAFKDIIVPIAAQYQPELVVLIAGYASNIFDPLCRQQITANGYQQLVECVQGIADKYAKGRLIAILEGGKGNYMSFCILKTIEAMSREETEVIDPVTGLIVRNHLTPDQNAAINEVKKVLSPYWKI